MEQLSLLMSPEERAFGMVRDRLLETLQKNGLDESYITMEKRKSYYSVMFDRSSVVFRLTASPNPTLAVPTSVLAASSSYSSMVEKADSDYTKIKLKNIEDIGEQWDLLQDILQGVIDRIPKEFDCCSRYMECSDATFCIHPDKKFALKCGYRKILKSGRIFYGKNRNID